MRKEHERGIRAIAHRVADKVAKTKHLPSDGVPGFYGVMMRRRERGTNSLPPRADRTMPAFSLKYKEKVMGCSEKEWLRHANWMILNNPVEKLNNYGEDYANAWLSDARPDWGEDVPGIDYSYRKE